MGVFIPFLFLQSYNFFHSITDAITETSNSKFTQSNQLSILQNPKKAVCIQAFSLQFNRFFHLNTEETNSKLNFIQ